MILPNKGLVRHNRADVGANRTSAYLAAGGDA